MSTANVIELLTDPDARAVLTSAELALLGDNPAGDIDRELEQILDSAIGPASSTPDYTKYSVWNPRICCC